MSSYRETNRYSLQFWIQSMMKLVTNLAENFTIPSKLWHSWFRKSKRIKMFLPLVLAKINRSRLVLNVKYYLGRKRRKLTLKGRNEHLNVGCSFIECYLRHYWPNFVNVLKNLEENLRKYCEYFDKTSENYIYVTGWRKGCSFKVAELEARTRCNLFFCRDKSRRL